MKPGLVVITTLIVVVACGSAQDDSKAFSALQARLIADGWDSTYVINLFSDPRLRFLPKVAALNLQPIEAPDLYDGFLVEEAVGEGVQFLRTWRLSLDSTLSGTHIPAEIIVGLLKIESDLGRKSGKYPIAATFATITLLADSLHWLDELEISSSAELERLHQRAGRRSNWAYRELGQFLKLCLEQGWDPLEIKGSWAGAFGWQQFLPSSHLRCARDGDGDQKINPFSLHDAVASMACYLQEAGWNQNPTTHRRALLQYNPSSAYVDCIMAYAQKLRKKIASTNPNSCEVALPDSTIMPER